MVLETLTVIVPCLNEERNVVPTVESVLAIAPELPVNVEIFLIDDGSTDGTVDQMERLCKQHPSCRMRKNRQNIGVGRSVMSAYSEVPDDSWITVLPGDHEIDFRSIHNFLKVRDQYDLILGYFQNPVIRPMRRRIASASFRQIVRSLYGFDFRYLNGLKMYRVEVMRGLEVKSSGYAYTAELIAKAMLRNPSLRIGEAPFIARGRAHGSSNAFRPTAIVNAAYEVMRGQRSVARYRKRVIKDSELETDRLRRASSHEGKRSAPRDSGAC
jgi:glycosyltransferase involved in cell wall biosynthesis